MAIINDNDMEIIMRGTQKKAIKSMLEDRCFALLKMPAEKPPRHISAFSSSVFVSHMNDSCAIRNIGKQTVYEKCEYYLKIHNRRGNDDETVNIFQRTLKRAAFEGTVVTYPSIEEFISFMSGKEMFVLTNYVEEHGKMEFIKSRHFQDDYLLLRKNADSLFILNDDFIDVRLFLTQISDEIVEHKNRAPFPIDVRQLDVNNKILKILKRECTRQYYDKGFYSVEYESNSSDIQASYYMTIFHSNRAWEADPVNFLTYRIAAFVLPGHLSEQETKDVPKKELAKNNVSGENYKIESIHFNSNICFDIKEFKRLVEFNLFEICLA